MTAYCQKRKSQKSLRASFGTIIRLNLEDRVILSGTRVNQILRRLLRQVATGRIISSMETPPCWKVPLYCL